MTVPTKLAVVDVFLILCLWSGAVLRSGNPSGFAVSTIPELVYVCILVAWRVYVRVSRSRCLRLRHAVLDGAVAGAILGIMWIGQLYSNYAFAAGVWWDGSDGSNLSDWHVWAFHLSEQTILLSIFGAMTGIVFWFFNAFLLLFPFYGCGLEARL
jgi:hypothetical protein